MPLFFAHGIIRTALDEIAPGKLRKKADAEYLTLHGQGVHRGKACLVVRSQTMQLSLTSYDEFWIDPSRQSAVLRYVMYSDKRIFNDIDIEYQQTAHGWLPQRWTFTHYSGTAPTVIYRMKVDRWEANPPTTEADFDIKAEPGMLVEERVYDESVHPLVDPKSAVRVYRLEEGGGKTEIPDPFGRPRDLSPRWRWWQWAAAAVVTATVLAGIGWTVRRRRLING
jgi:hypothetical protein